MVRVSEVKGILFSVTLTDGSVLTLMPGETANIEESKVSDSLRVAVSMGRVKMFEVKTETKSKEKSTGGAK